MKVLKATQDQYEALNGYSDGSGRIEFVKDGLDNWIVGETVLLDSAFIEILPQLQQLEEIEYFAPEQVESEENLSSLGFLHRVAVKVKGWFA